MWNLISCSHISDKSNIKDIIIIDGIDNLDFNILINKLTEKLEEGEENEDSFIEVIKEIKDNLYR